MVVASMPTQLQFILRLPCCPAEVYLVSANLLHHDIAWAAVRSVIVKTLPEYPAGGRQQLIQHGLPIHPWIALCCKLCVKVDVTR